MGLSEIIKKSKTSIVPDSSYGYEQDVYEILNSGKKEDYYKKEE